MFAGSSYNLALIAAVLIFWAFTKRRALAAAAIDAWRRRRAAQAPLPAPLPALSSHCGPAAPYPAALQVTPSPAVPGQGSETGVGQGSGEASGQGPGEGSRRQVETLGNGVTGMWIKVGQHGDDRA